VIVPKPHACQEHGDRDLDQTIRAAVSEQAAHVPSYWRMVDYAITRDPLPRTHLGSTRTRVSTRKRCFDDVISLVWRSCGMKLAVISRKHVGG
jgi:hypothetical protein